MAIVGETETPTATATATVALYVGDLDGEVDDDKLHDAFREFKSVTSARVCRDSSSGRSLSYGYVNFLSPQDAINAIEKKNHSTLNGKAIRVMWSHRDSDARRSGVGNVFVKNLSNSIDSAKLQQVFDKYGNISSAKVATSENGKSKGYGFVQFLTEDSARAAIENLNGTSIEGKQIYVGKFMRRTDRVLSGPDVKYTNLYIKNLDLDTSEETLRENFSKYGKIVSSTIVKDENGASKGFGFVNFENPDDAKQAMEAMDGSQLGSKTLYVSRAQKKAEREQILRRQFEEKRKEQLMKYMGSNVYIKNIADEVTDDELRELFSRCGSITSAKIMRDGKGISKGFGFVCLSTPEEASKAVTSFHGYMYHRKPLYVAIAQRKEERKAQLQLRFAQRMAGLASPSSAVMPPSGYPNFYFTPPQGLMYPTIGLRPAWHDNAFAAPSATYPPFHPLPVLPPPNNIRPKRPSRGKINGQPLPQSGLPTQPSVGSVKDSTYHQRTGQVKYMGNVKREVKKTSAVADGPENLSSTLAAAAPQQQKEILGNRLFPLVHNLKPELAAKITGMLLEMDNAELLLLLESPELLATKVEEAMQVLKLSRTTNIPNQENLHSNFLSAEVAVS